MSEDDTYEIPLQDQRVFGAGIKRTRVRFVPSSAETPSATSASTETGTSVGDRYLKLVLPKDGNVVKNETSGQEVSPDGISLPSQSASAGQGDSTLQLCAICHLPLTSTSNETTSHQHDDTRLLPPHEANLAHQVSLPHSHPPSHLDRSRRGLHYLSAYGWDPDARVGLGSQGQGIPFPIKAKPKDDTLGIGAEIPRGVRKAERKIRLDAGRTRRNEARDKVRMKALKDEVYGREDVARYLNG